MSNRFLELAKTGDVQAIWAVLNEIVSSDKRNEDDENSIKELSRILYSRIDSLTDDELFWAMRMYCIDTIPYVKRLAEHNHPTALCKYAWVLYRGDVNCDIQQDEEASIMFLNQAVDCASKVTNGGITLEGSGVNNRIFTYEYRVTGAKACLDFFTTIIEAITGKETKDESTMEVTIPYDVVFYVLAGGNCGGRYKGTIKHYKQNEDGILLVANSDTLSSGAFASAIELFFVDLITGSDMVNVERNKLTS